MRDAFGLYRSAASTECQQGTCLYRVGCALAELGRYDEAQTAFRDAIALHPGLRDDIEQDDDGSLDDAWSERRFARGGDCPRRFRRCL